MHNFAALKSSASVEVQFHPGSGSVISPSLALFHFAGCGVERFRNSSISCVPSRVANGQRCGIVIRLCSFRNELHVADVINVNYLALRSSYNGCNHNRMLMLCAVRVS